MSDKDKDGRDVQETIEQLSQAVGEVETDDLAGLAKMHGWCEILVEETGPDAAQPCPTVFETASALTHNLEALILGECGDPAQALAAVAESVAGLSGTAPSSTETLAQEVEAPEEKAQASEAEVASKLDKVFEEEGEPAAEALPDATENPQDAAEAEAVPADSEASKAKDAAGDAAPKQGAEPPAQPPYEPEPLVIAQNEIDFVGGFVEEAGEHIEAIELAVLEVERSPDDTAKIDDLFRPFHTIKGMAGFLNLRDINSLTHEVETLLDQGRKGTRQVTPELIDLVFEVVDILKIQVGEISAYMKSPTGKPVPQPPVAQMIDRLRGVVAGRLTLEAREAGPGQPGQRVGENLVEQKAVAPEAVEWALEQQAQQPGKPKKLGETLVDKGVVTPRQVAAALRPQAQGAAGGGAVQRDHCVVGDQSVRIETAKLDGLVDMVGELVIAQTLVGSNPVIAGDPKLSKDVGQVAKIVRDVQEAAMAMRMIPIGTTFQRMARLVRDVSRKAGKKVELTISGEETELDKNVIQQISDPLVHMVRNAVDHGIELPQERLAADKDETGHVHLSAFHQGGNIVIQIRDDGKGLDRDQLVAKGVDKGLVHPGEELTDEQAYALIFAPGFSTAAQVTDISGRGVGMDVVRRNIEQLRGRTGIESQKGHGSTFSICLPLTLAIIDGMVVRVGNERFVLQTITIEQALRPLPEYISTVQGRGELLNARGRLIPLIQLGELFGLSGRIDPCEAMVIIAQCDGGQIGLVVEELIGQQQVVIKSLGERFEELRGISGVTILGDGRVGLILEMSGIAEAHNTWHSSSAIPPRTVGSSLLAASTDDQQDQETLSAPDDQPGDEACSEHMQQELSAGVAAN